MKQEGIYIAFAQIQHKEMIGRRSVKHSLIFPSLWLATEDIDLLGEMDMFSVTFHSQSSISGWGGVWTNTAGNWSHSCYPLSKALFLYLIFVLSGM